MDLNIGSFNVQSIRSDIRRDQLVRDLESYSCDILCIQEHFRSKFEDEAAEEITPFQGEPKPLKNPITPEEVRKSFNSLSNNKATGEDQIH